MKKFFLLLPLVFCGCEDQNSPAVKEKNVKTLSGPGTAIGVLPDGRTVISYEINRGDQHPHTIYIVGDVTTTNSESGGKGSYNKVEVLIDGRVYIPKE